jgi:hypothetical protein
MLSPSLICTADERGLSRHGWRRVEGTSAGLNIAPGKYTVRCKGGRLSIVEMKFLVHKTIKNLNL